LNGYETYVIVFMAVIIFIQLLLYNMRTKKVKEEQFEKNILQQVMKVLNINKKIEESFSDLLVVISEVIKAPSYAIYILDEKKSSYVLKAVRQKVDELSNIAPAYSGLTPFKKEVFVMPNSVPLAMLTKSAQKVKDGEVPLVLVPFKNKEVLILIGPLKKVSQLTLNKLDIICEKLETIVETLMEFQKNKNKIKQVVTSGDAVKNFSSYFNNFNAMLELVMKVSVNAINAKGGLFISSVDGKVSLNTNMGISEESIKLIGEDTDTLNLLMNLIGNSNYVSVSNQDKVFYKIPPYFVSEDIKTMQIFNVKNADRKSIAVFLYNESTEMKEYQITALQVMTKRMGDIIKSYDSFKHMSMAYIDILKMLARLIDNLKPATVGYSELMYRYAIIISTELGLSKEDTKDIALAAFLSNIGVIGLSEDILFKPGKYTQVEYETMKYHAEAGAALIEATTGNIKVASYIRQHHERIDGYGYPNGLSGDDVSIGAKIIAVIQTFLAKVISREYRTALPFNEAMDQLKAAVGTQLDKEVVYALAGWFDKKQKEFGGYDAPLGPCWEMRCSTESICLSCPAYKNENKRCWESDGVKCSEHGNICESCYVKSEYLSRMRR
jgi:HD-GYP domain-containing protein (c-di-GMP phosphodiesterase class II)